MFTGGLGSAPREATSFHAHDRARVALPCRHPSTTRTGKKGKDKEIPT